MPQGHIIFNAQNRNNTPQPGEQNRWGIYGMGVNLTPAVFANMSSYIQGWFFRLDWSQVEPNKNGINWNQLETDFQLLWDSDKYICFQVNLASKNDRFVTPQWIYDTEGVEKVPTTQSGPEYMPWYVQPGSPKGPFVNRVEQLYDQLISHFVNYSETKLSKILFMMSAEGTTGDDSPYGQGNPIGPPGDPNRYDISDNVWKTYRRTQWTMIRDKLASLTPSIQCMVNPGNDGEEHEWALANIDGVCIKSGYPAHEYNMPATLEYDIRFNSMRSLPVTSGNEYKIRGEHENEQGIGWWDQNGPNERANEFSQICQCVHLNNSFYSFTQQNAVGNAGTVLADRWAYLFYNKYAGSRNATDTTVGFCQLRDMIDIADTVRFPVSNPPTGYGPVHDTSVTDVEYNNHIANINSSGTLSSGQKAIQIAKYKIDHLNDTGSPNGILNRVALLRAAFPEANYDAKPDTSETGTNGLMQDYSIDCIGGNYFRYVTQYSPNTTSEGKWRVGIANSFHGRHGRQFLETGLKEMYFTLDTGLSTGAANTIKIDVIYYDQGAGVWIINAAVGGVKTEVLRVTKAGSNTWRTATVTATNCTIGGDLLHGSDIIIEQINGTNTVFSSIEVAISGKPTINVKTDFSAVGNGVADDSAAFQAAEDYLASVGGGNLYVPAGTYIIRSPFYHRSFVTLYGDGDTSIIKNPITVKNGDDQFCIHIGNFDPDTFIQCVHYDVSNIAQGATQVTLSNPANAQFFAVGKIILVDSIAGWMSNDGLNHWKPYLAFINKVTAINGAVITLEEPVSEAINGAQIAPTDKWVAGTGNTVDKVYICQNAEIRNIRFESLGDWTLRYGCYKTLFDNVSIKSTDGIGANGLSHCTFTNIRVQFSQKVIEMALYSHDVVVDGFTATWWNGVPDPALKPLLKMGENIRDCDFSNVTISMVGAGAGFGMVMRFEHAFNNKIHDCTFNCQAVSQDGVLLEASDVDSVVTGNEVTNNVFVLGNTDYYVHLENNETGAVVSGNIVTGNTFSGGANNQNVKLVGNVGSNTTTPNTFN